MKTSVKFFKIIGASLLIVFAAGENAKAVAITGDINFGGMATVNGGGFAFATAFTSFSGVTVAGGTGDYSAVPIGTPVTYPATGFTFAPLPATVSPLWTFTLAGPTAYSFDLESITMVDQNAFSLMVTGTGVAKIDGFDNTEGSWIFGAFGNGVTGFGFSAFNQSSGVGVGGNNSVPEGGATAAMLGFSLIGVASLRRKLGARV